MSVWRCDGVDTSPPGKPKASSIPQCSCQASWKGRSKDGPSLPQQAGQVSHTAQAAGVGGGDGSFARWDWGPDLSEEPWMNQPDHSHPNCSDGENKLFFQLPLQRSFSFPFSPWDSGCGRAVVEAHLWSWWLSWVRVLELQPWPSRYSTQKWAAFLWEGGCHKPCPEQRFGSRTPGLTHLVFPSNTSYSSQRSCPILFYNRATFYAVLGTKSVQKQNIYQSYC